jgi:hypothetical protein
LVRLVRRPCHDQPLMLSTRLTRSLVVGVVTWGHELCGRISVVDSTVVNLVHAAS